MLLFGIAGSAENRPLDFTDALWATAGIALILLASWIEKGRNRL
ncbi:hypothetical protein [Deinococcus enclensis]|uniref:Uncharacterized protein n=1 Tax=Deinococcus enclensis TaxID=1049582 RepID=A0ABT9MC77_9DEIO|nr:hypothetical protein [Deinococcus enclensis]MDP9763874.1 hypothetical protein [Deinococcus enclensis]